MVIGVLSLTTALASTPKVNTAPKAAETASPAETAGVTFEPLTQAEKADYAVMQRNFVSTQNQILRLKQQYDDASSAVAKQASELNAEVDEMRQAHKLAKDTPFDQDKLQFNVPKTKAEDTK